MRIRTTEDVEAGVAMVRQLLNIESEVGEVPTSNVSAGAGANVPRGEYQDNEVHVHHKS